MTAAVNVASLGTAMSADSSGNVGIGASPSYRLDVNATSFIAASVSTSYSGAGNIRIADASTTSASAPYIGSVGNNLTFGRVGTAEYARIDSSGNLLVGTTTANGRITAVSPDNTASTKIASFYANNLSQGIYIGYDNIATTASGQPMRFVVGSTAEAMRIDSSGNFMVGTTSTSVTSSFQVKRSGGNPVAVHNNGGTSGFFNQILFLNNAGTADIGYIARTNDNSVAYNTTSDYRLKENIAPMTGALATVQLLKPVTYKWKSDGSEGQGFIAHELKAVVPDCVTGEKDAVKEQQYEVTPAVMDEDGNTVTEAVMGTRTVPSYQGIDTSFLVATLTAAIQEQQALITQLQADVAELKGRP